MTKEQLAEKLNGREMGEEMLGVIERDAKESGLVVIFGASYDLTEFRGAIYDEVACYNGAIIKLHASGPLSDHEERCKCKFCGYEAAASKCANVEAVWSQEDDQPCWTYKTTIPHATFEILEGAEIYCRGIVIELSALPTI